MMKIDADAGEIADVRGVLTEMQAAFVRFYVSLGGDATKAADAAGYTHPGPRGYELTQKPHIQSAIRIEQGRLIVAEGATKSINFMIRAIDDQKLTGAVRFQSAKWLAEAAGHGLAAQRAMLGLPPQDKPLSEMTLDELDAFISAGKAATTRLKEERDRTIEGRVVRDDVRSNGADSAQASDHEGAA